MCMFKNDKCLVEEIFVTQHYRMALKYYFHVEHTVYQHFCEHFNLDEGE